MREETEANQIFTPDMIETMAHIWTRSTISLIDVRHQHICPERPLRQYRMPGSMLVYAYGGTASVQLNETAFAMERFGLFHGGKGTMLSISPDDVMLESYMVLYKAETPSFFQKDLQRLLEQVNPFVQRFGYAPGNPVWLVGLFRQMMDSWSCQTKINHFHAKSLFYQSMYEIYKDLERKEARFLQLDPVLSAKRYLDEHYMSPILFQEIADMFAISRGQLTRLFKKSEGKSLQEYLTMKRLELARHHLLHTNATVKEIALGCGLVDELNLNRMFKRHYKIAPSEYRNKKIGAMHTLDIDNNSQRLYNEIGLDNLAKSQRDGEFTMFGQTRNKQMILAAAMSLMLLLSACGTAPANSTNGAGAQNTPPAATQTPAAATKAEAAWPRTYVDATGAEVVIEKQPERIALTHFSTFEILYALGATPVAFLDVEEYLDRMSTLESLRAGDFIDLGSPPNLERILDAKPDLIIDNYGLGDIRAELEEIAPVVVPHDKTADFPSDAIREYAKIIGKEKEVEAFISNLKTKLNEAREQLASVDDTVMIIGGNGKTVSIYGLGVTTPLYTEVGLGLNAPEGLPNTWWEESSLEALTVYNPDHIFMRTTQERFDQAIAEFSKSAVWNSLNAVKNDQVYILEEAMFLSGPLGIQLLADYVVEKLVK